MSQPFSSRPNPVSMRSASFETHVAKEVEEKLWLVDGIRDEEISPFIIDVTAVDSDDDSDNDSDYALDEGGVLKMTMTWKLILLMTLTTLMSPNHERFVREQNLHI